MAEDAPLHEFLLRGLELRLLRCTFFTGNSPPPPPQSTEASRQFHPNSLLPLIESVVSSIERGNYAEALNSDAVRRVFGFSASWEFEDTVEAAGRFYGEVERSVEAFLGGGSENEAWLQVLDVGNGGGGDGDDEDDTTCRSVLLMCIGVAALLAFTQRNMTGPINDFSAFPLPFPLLDVDNTVGCGGKWDSWAHLQLTSSGSDMFGKLSMLQYIVYSKILLEKTKDLVTKGRGSYFSGTKSVSWWLARVILLQQRIVDELSSSLYELLGLYITETLHQFGNSESVTSYWGSHLCDGEALVVVSMAYLEAGIGENTYGRVDSSRKHFNSSERASGLHLSVTGALGYRTVHQVNAKSQMVLVNRDSQEKDGRTLIKCSEHGKEDHNSENKNGANENCDILMTPRLLENENNNGVDGSISQDDGSSNGPLTAIQQAVILAQCLYINRSSPDDELSRWKMAPFIEAIDAQQHSHFIIRCFCDILRIRWEFSRSRTKERAYLMMDKLVKRVDEDLPRAEQRIQFCYGVQFPTTPALRKEYGEFSVSCGLIGEALKIFEDLELWDNIIYCYRLLGKKSAAVDLIKARLADMPNDPKLWCSLGDVTNTDAYYEKALEVSCNRSARAKRSLARSAYNRGDYVASKFFWESAMALNSMYPDGWFALGAAALKARDLDKALEGFINAVQLDPDNGEAWNNIACLHMVRKKNKEAYIAFKEALRFRRNSWQLWQNYSHVAFDTGNFRQALDATKMVLDLSANKQIDTELLAKLMTEVEERTSKTMFVAWRDSTPRNDTCKLSADSATKYEYLDDKVETAETEFLVEMLGKVLQQIVRSGGGDGIWGLYARWHRITGDLIMCSEALLKQVRSYQGSDLWHDQDRFKKFAHASVELCNVYMEISSSTRSRRELNTAELHLRSSIKQAVNFSNTEELSNLQVCLDEVRKRLGVLSAGDTANGLV